MNKATAYLDQTFGFGCFKIFREVLKIILQIKVCQEWFIRVTFL